MKRVYSTEILANAWHIRNVLEQYDIDSVIRNENLFSVAGEVPFIECMPEVWVKPLYFRRAKQIIAELESSSQAEGPDWKCSGCGESNMISYSVCWKCQSSDEKPMLDEEPC